MAKQTQQSQTLDDEDDLLEEHDEHEDDDHEESPNGKSDKGAQDDERLKETDDELPEEDDQAVLERRRQERKERKERRAEAIRRDKLEMKYLRERNDALERRLDGVEQGQRVTHTAQIDQRMNQTVANIRAAERVLAKAVEAKNGQDVVRATQLRDQAVHELNQLNALKQRAQQPTRTNSQPQVDHEVKRRAERFVESNNWYDPQGGDEDSAIVLAIDSTLARQGLDPSKAEYWTELQKRVQQRLPHRFDDRDDGGERRSQRGGPSIGGGRQQSQRSQETIKISAERKQALMDAGVWEDPKLRAKYIKKYQEYDKAHK